MKESDAERMAMRDGFAMAALVGLLSGHDAAHGSKDWPGVEIKYANSAYSLAEAMMEVRSARPLP